MADLIANQILSKLGILSLEHHPDGQLSILGEPPKWAIALLVCVRNHFSHLLPVDISPFLENFITDAEEFWQTLPGEELRSGLWTETFKDQTEINLEAVAIFIDQRKIILIEASTSAYLEKLSWLQIARQEQLQILSERKISATRMMSATFYDTLTGLPNHTFFTAQLSQLTAYLNQSANQHFAILNLNLDSFQGINDSLGRDLGDQLLIEMAQRLKSGLKAGDIVARLGSDEFGILLVSLQSQADIDDRVKGVRSRLASPYQLGDQLIYTTVSIGMVVANQSGQTARDLFRDVCTAMHHAKGLGRDHLVNFDPAMHFHAMKLLNLERDLHFAVKNQELDHDFRPFISLKAQKILGVEIVIHWNHPTLGKLSPHEFIPLALESQQIIPIDEFSLLTAGRLLNDWSLLKNWSETWDSVRTSVDAAVTDVVDASEVRIMLSINGPTLLSDTFIHRLETVVQVYNCAPQQLILQVNEKTVLQHLEQIKDCFQDLRARGFQICLTELGSQFTSWQYLENVSLDYLKLEGNLVDLVERSSGSLIQEITHLAHSLELEVISDQVDTPDQCQTLTTLGCDIAQGDFISSAFPKQDWVDRP